MQHVAVFKWSLLASGSPLLNESDLAATVLNILIGISERYPSRDADGAVIRPLPRVNKILSDPASLCHVVQLVPFSPLISNRPSTLMATPPCPPPAADVRPHPGGESGHAAGPLHGRQSDAVAPLHHRRLLLRPHVHGYVG